LKIYLQSFSAVITLLLIFANTANAQLDEGFESGLPAPNGSSVESSNSLSSGTWLVKNAYEYSTAGFINGGSNSTYIKKSSDAHLKWETAAEVNNYGFEIERCIDKEKWEKIGFVEGHGNSNSPKQYSFVDANYQGEHQFQYRLKQIDTDGTFEYSEILEVEIDAVEFVLYQNYPNPFNPKTKIGFSTLEKGEVKLSIHNILGVELKVLVNAEKEAGYHSVEFDASDLSSGVYLYQLNAGKFIETKKLILLK